MNFIVFVADEFRQESLFFDKASAENAGVPPDAIESLVGNTPNLNAFAQSGTRFTQCHTANTTCSQSRASFMTGWYTHVRGHRTLYSLLQPDEPNFLKYFKRAGYDVMWWGENDLLSPGAFANSVTSVVDYNTDPKKMAIGPPFDLDGPNRPRDVIDSWDSLLFESWPGELEDSGEYLNVKAAIDFLQTRADQGSENPFVLYLPMLHPHPPYSCPKAFYDRIHPEQVPDLRPWDLKGAPDYRELIREYRHLKHLPESFFRRLQSVYLGSIGYVDALFGRLIDALDETSLAEDTTVLFFSDHGDYAGDYGLVEKWPSGLEDVLTRVPLIIRTPDGKQNHAVNENVQLMDIVPTLLNLADIEIQHTHYGRDLGPMLRGDSSAGEDEIDDGIPRSFRGNVVFAEGGYGTNEPFEIEQITNKKANPYYPKYIQQYEHRLSVCRATMMRTSKYKLILRTDPTDLDHHSEFYCLEDDPRELRNRYSDPDFSGVIRQLKDLMLLWYIETSDAIPWKLDPRDSPTLTLEPTPPADQPDQFQNYVPFR